MLLHQIRVPKILWKIERRFYSIYKALHIGMTTFWISNFIVTLRERMSKILNLICNAVRKIHQQYNSGCVVYPSLAEGYFLNLRATFKI